MFTWPRRKLSTIERTQDLEAASENPSDIEKQENLPVLSPKFPAAVELAKHLSTTNESNASSERLVIELSRHLGLPQDTLVTAASGTKGIAAALRSLDLPTESVCLMPSWTSVATPQAAIAAGLKPQFLDVDRRTWALNPHTVKHSIEQSGCAARAIVVVSPFGAPIDIRGWESFQAETGISVVIDAASGFDTVRQSSLISVVSMNANQIFSAGEGGFVVTPNTAVRDRVQAFCEPNYESRGYQSALALASLDIWPATRLKHLQVTGWYRHAFSHLPRVCLQPGYGAGWVSGYTNILLESDSAESISRFMLREGGIETKLWWGAGCHTHPEFADCPRSDMSKTEYLGSRVLGLPHYPDMQKPDVTRVVHNLSKALASRARGRRRPI